jgi:spore coat polysaccharide biosynthesis protein SpsF
MTLAVIVQARMGSTRLPAKVLEDLGGRTALARCLARCQTIPGADIVVAAVPDGADNDPVAREAASTGAAVVRGSESDVLARYAKAARAVRATTVMRVTSDCPFIDPAVCAAVIALYFETGADYASNTMPALWPHGLDCEIFPARLLYEAETAAEEPYDREHVTPWLRRAPGLVRAGLQGPGGGLERLRWTLDQPEDLAFFRAVYDAMGERAAHASSAEIAALCLRRPDIVALNAGRIDEARLAARVLPERLSAPVGLPKAA